MDKKDLLLNPGTRHPISTLKSQFYIIHCKFYIIFTVNSMKHTVY